MSQRRISIYENTNTYFVTMTVQRWYYLFDRHQRWDILADSLRYCQKNKHLEINAYVFMLNHLHMIISSPDISGFLRDFKKFTSKQLKINLEKTEPNVLKLFIDEETGLYQLWKNANCPKIIESPKFYLQKLEYIHQNPVRKNYVAKPEYWFWSSANPESPLEVRFLDSF